MDINDAIKLLNTTQRTMLKKTLEDTLATVEVTDEERENMENMIVVLREVAKS